jgi:thiaminase/transcriptional activator TenA
MTMSFCDDLFDEVRPVWEAQLEHPFVVGIAEGTLDEEKFIRWVRQDYRYLEEFSRVFAWGAAKANDLDEMQFFAGALDLTLNTEMDLHRSYAERFGLTDENLEATTMWPTTRAYTDFLVRVSADGDLSELLAALLPCAWGYAWLGDKLEANYETPDDDRYADWIATYTDEEFQGAAEHLRMLMDRHAASADPAKRDRLTDLFVTSSRYEWRFWEMCWEGEEWQP